jgi:hypothetical protein
MLPDERVALYRARGLLDRCGAGYICIALMDVEIQYPHLKAACMRLRHYIWEQLGGELGSAPTLSSWQKKRGIYRTPQQLHQDRLDWITWMLGEGYESSGTDSVDSGIIGPAGVD